MLLPPFSRRHQRSRSDSEPNSSYVGFGNLREGRRWLDVGARLPSGCMPAKKQVLSRAAVRQVTQERQECPSSSLLKRGSERRSFASASGKINRRAEWPKVGAQPPPAVAPSPSLSRPANL